MKYVGAADVADQVGAWATIGTQKTATGYEVAWKVFVSKKKTAYDIQVRLEFRRVLFGSWGASYTLESLETSFHQDLNGDGMIGAPSQPAKVIASSGSTSLVEVNYNFYLDGLSSGSGPEERRVGKEGRSRWSRYH